jgi:hypothetical protein
LYVCRSERLAKKRKGAKEEDTPAPAAPDALEVATEEMLNAFVWDFVNGVTCNDPIYTEKNRGACTMGIGDSVTQLITKWGA